MEFVPRLKMWIQVNSDHIERKNNLVEFCLVENEYWEIQASDKRGENFNNPIFYDLHI